MPVETHPAFKPVATNLVKPKQLRLSITVDFTRRCCPGG
jgi:hypothetical protein